MIPDMVPFEDSMDIAAPTADEISEAVRNCHQTLHRRPADRFEAAVVLEAFHGIAAAKALRLGQEVVWSVRNEDVLPVEANDRFIRQGDAGETDHALRRQLFLGEIGFVFSVLVIGFWISRLSGSLANGQVAGTAVDASWRAALPVTLGAQWILRRRYFAGDDGLGRLRREPQVMAVVLVASLLLGRIAGGVLGGVLAILWTAGFIIARRGWWRAQLGLLILAIIFQSFVDHPLAVLFGCAAIAVLGVAQALRTSELSDRIPGPWSTALLAGILGAGLGGLLVVEPEFVWGVTSKTAGVIPILSIMTVVPSLFGSLWAAHRMTSLWDNLPNELLERRVSARSATAGSGSITLLFLGSLGRIVICCGALSSLLIVWVLGSDLPIAITVRLLVAHAVLGTAGLCVSLLEAFGRAGRAILCVAVGTGVALLLPTVIDFAPPATRILTAAVLTALLSTLFVLRLFREPARTIVLGV
jgi:hypothetical protein